MKRKNYLIHVVIFTLAINLFSCKGKEGEPGPKGDTGATGATGAQGLQGEKGTEVDYHFKDGYIKADISGTMSDSTTFEWEADFKGVYGIVPAEVHNTEDSRKLISFERVYAGDGDKFDHASIDISFIVDDLDTFGDPEVQFVYWNAIKKLKDFTIYRSESRNYHAGGNGSASVSDLKYDKKTHILTGNFSTSMPADDNSGALVMKNGKFSVTLYNIVSRIAE